ncbi:MAG: methionine ABC transporter ATP-binding protein [Actinobacteria bacterium]|nr:MAG: methionine ABC transporter ATP-binding protein [Actinomycetota bacterium]
MSSTNDTKADMVGDVATDPTAPLLEVDNLHVEFRIEDGTVRAVNGLSYMVGRGETLAILGESGSGKSVSAQAVMGILDTPPGYVTEGSVKFRGVELFKPGKKKGTFDHAVPEVRGTRIAMVFQDALTSLNPVFTVGWQIGEMFRVHQGASRKEAKEKAIEMMERVKIPDARERVNAYPHEFSGGMRQRVMIAMSLSLNPDVLIADEPTTALDVTVQSQIMELLGELQQETGMGLILITHDLAVVAEVADRVVVMYAGRRMERGGIDDIFHRPSHPYTLGLMDSIARPDVHLDRLKPIPGSPPDLLAIPSGCPFHPRCSYAKNRCATDVPELETVDGQHASACFYWKEVQVEL